MLVEPKRAGSFYMHVSKTGFYNKIVWAIAMLISLFFIIVFLGCEADTPQDTAVVDDPPTRKEDAVTYERQERQQIEDDSTPALKNAEPTPHQILSEEELLKYEPNELGLVMVLMYHHIGDTESEWFRTPKILRKTL
ncbi:MAG: hypothetical protein U5N58_01710 [Actinomycetota bacterium]|nr:hypothetical protein [Actinomycetota bacterium]